MAATADALLERLSSVHGRTGLFLVAVGSHGLELSPAARAVAGGPGAARRAAALPRRVAGAVPQLGSRARLAHARLPRRDRRRRAGAGHTGEIEDARWGTTEELAGPLRERLLATGRAFWRYRVALHDAALAALGRPG